MKGDDTMSYARWASKEEIVVHWLGCDSCDYYIRVDSPEWCFISPSQLISKNDIKKEDYLWVFLAKRKD